jgi:hypothetical protein
MGNQQSDSYFHPLTNENEQIFEAINEIPTLVKKCWCFNHILVSLFLSNLHLGPKLNTYFSKNNVHTHISRKKS